MSASATEGFLLKSRRSSPSAPPVKKSRVYPCFFYGERIAFGGPSPLRGEGQKRERRKEEKGRDRGALGVLLSFMGEVRGRWCGFSFRQKQCSIQIVLTLSADFGKILIWIKLIERYLL